MWRKFLLLLSLTAFSVTCESLYGSSDLSDIKFNNDSVSPPRLVNGLTARTGEYPWHAIIYARIRNANNWIFCSGVLVSDLAVLTEAGCLVNSVEIRVFLGSNIFARGVQVLGAQFRTHPYYTPNSAGTDGYNIAVLRLATRVPLSHFIRPISLVPSRYEYYNFPGQPVRFAGFGSTCKYFISSINLVCRNYSKIFSKNFR